MPKIQINITDEANNVLAKLNQKNTKSIFIDLAIKNFEKTKEAKLFLSANDEKKGRIKELTIRDHIIVFGEIGTGKTTRLKELITTQNLNNEKTLVIDVKPLNLWLEMDKEVKFKVATFSNELTLKNFKTIIIDEAFNINDYPSLKKQILDSFVKDKATFIMSFQKEKDVSNFLKFELWKN